MTLDRINSKNNILYIFPFLIKRILYSKLLFLFCYVIRMKVKYKKLSFLSFFFFYVLFCYCPHKLLEKNGYSAPFFYLCSMMEWYTNFCSFRKRFSKQMIFVRIHFFHNLLCQYEEKYCSVGKYYIAREFEETSIFRNSFKYFLILWVNNWKML